MVSSNNHTLPLEVIGAKIFIWMIMMRWLIGGAG